MTFTFNNYATNQLSQNPLNDMIQNIMSGYTDMTKAKYLQPGLEEELKKAKLYNQYYGPNIESQIGLRGAQAGHANSLTAGQNITNRFLPQSLQAQINERGARTGLLGEQMTGAHIENEWLPQKLQAGIAESQANAQKAHLLQMIRERMMGGGQLSGGQEDAMPGSNSGQMGMFQGQGMPMNGDQEGQKQQHQRIQDNSVGMDYAQAATTMQALGLGKPHVVEANGKYIAITPFGNIDTGVAGLNAEQKALQSGFGKYGAKLYGDSVDTYKNYQNQGLALNELIDAAENNTQFRNVTGKINKPLANWFGSPQQQELLGRLQSTSGEIALQVAPALKGAFTGRDQTLINEIKASPNDFPDVFIGKLKAQKLINDVLTERSKLTAEYLEKGYKPLESSRMAAFETPLDRFRPQIKQLTSHKKLLTPNELIDAKKELERRGVN
jgi:hypothetical protein